MRFSLSPPPPKATSSAATSPTMQSSSSNSGKMTGSRIGDENLTETADDAASDYKQWLHAMKLVARLPGGMPPEFRRKLWLSLADKYLKSKNIDWAKEEEKCFCEKWREDDEELGIQIVKDLHRTGSNLCSGPAGSINQAKLKRILLGYARYNPEVGYCQGFNMLGALILQVMDKEESESMKVMIYLVEGVLPPGYFCGSMGGLQADMGVFRELMTSKLPRLAKHLQKLQGPIENAYEPPLTNVFTMQWFLTMFCTCLPMTCVLRVWDLVLIEGSDVLLRTALVLWSLLEERILRSRTADDFYCKMGSFSSELLNGHLIDSNGLIEKVVQLGPISDIQRLRDKHLYNIAPLRHKQGLQLYFDDEESGSDEESRLAVATVWGIPWGRRGSSGQATITNKPLPESKDRLALDISLLKKQYDRLRERQKQAHIILTTACSTAARQGTTTTTSNTGSANPTLPVNQLLMGRSAIVINKGRRIGPPPGAIPPARKPSLPAVLQTKPPEKQLRRGETLHWRDTDISKRRRDSLTWKEIKADRLSLTLRDSSEESQPRKVRTRLGKSDSSSYSDESGDDDDGSGNGSSTDTSLCDDDDPSSTGDKAVHGSSSIENSPKKKTKLSRKQKELSTKLKVIADAAESSKVQKRPKSWAPTNDEIPFMLMKDSPVQSVEPNLYDDIVKEDENSATESDRVAYKFTSGLHWSSPQYSAIAGDLATTALGPLHIQTDVLELPVITSTSQLSPLPDIASYLNDTTISPLPTPKPLFLDSTNSLGSGDGEGGLKSFDVNDDGVTNEYFERVNSVERPNKLELFYSLSEEDDIRNAYEVNEESKAVERLSVGEGTSSTDPVEIVERTYIEGCEDRDLSRHLEENMNDQRRMKLLDDYSEKSSVACIAEATNEVSTGVGKQKDNNEAPLSNEVRKDFEVPVDSDDINKDTSKLLLRKHSFNESRKKRRDPRRLTITHWSAIEAEEFKIHKEHSDAKGRLEEPSVYKPTAIPSTADLEKRFNKLEKQLSSGNNSAESGSNNILTETIDISHKEKEDSAQPKHVLKIPSLEDQDPLKTSPKDSSELKLDDPKSSIQKVEAECTQSNSCRSLSSKSQVSSAVESNNIPSTADLESRFDALERQHSSTKISGLKNSGNAEHTENCNAVEVQSQDFNDVAIPSTKSLEERFDALERQMSSSSAPAVKNNKEPQCNAVDTDSSKDIKAKSSENNSLQEKEHQVPSIPSEGDLENCFTALERQKSSSSGSVIQNIVEPEENTSLQEKEHKVPSISSAENLENHFTALERQKSSSSSSNVKNIVEPESNKYFTETSNETKSQSMEKTPLQEKKQMVPSIPSAKDLENRFTALKRQMSSSSSCVVKNIVEPEERTNLQEKEEDLEDRSKSQPTEKTPLQEKKQKVPSIPSTEDLETRFTALERQMSTSKTSIPKDSIEPHNKADDKKIPESNGKDLAKGTQNKSQMKENKSPLERQMSPSSSSVVKNIVEPEEINTLQEKEHTMPSIPSTEDLESRFTALERQMSTSTTSKPKDSIEPHNKADDKKSPNSNGKDPAKGSQSQTNMKENKTKTNAVETDTTNEMPEKETKPRLSKIPSTAELEDRFNALERKISVSKSNAAKTKKEPPDLATTSKEIAPKSSESQPPDKNVSSDDVDCEKIINETKKPPSTEELEKRFENMEKQLISDQKVKMTKSPQPEQNTQAEDVEKRSRTPQQKSPALEKETKQSFHDKCKIVNEQLTEEQPSEQSTAPALTKDAKLVAETKKIKAMQSFQTHSKEKAGQEELSEAVLDELSVEPSKISVKRRASEPPTTEDLESRYEALKRRMSTKPVIDANENRKKSLLKSETVEEALERIEKEVLDENVEEVQDTDEEASVSNQASKEEKVSPDSRAVLENIDKGKRRASEPPTTEELEKRYEKLKRRTTKAEIIAEMEAKEEIDYEAIETSKNPKQITSEAEIKKSTQPTTSNIPVPPPMQSQDTYEVNTSTIGGDRDQRQALVDELQSKMKPNDENLKPSDVNPNQRRIPPSIQQRPTKGDETSETHATTASKLKQRKNCEPFQLQQPHKMVRRFSDLPSRADLENRVEFLEQQLSLKLIKQRSASDSEVSSRMHFVGERPSTSTAKHRNDVDLENRVFALEKQLSENSLKLIEAMRIHDRQNTEENLSPEVVNAEVFHPSETGKELVRYSHYGEVEESESMKPFNISINIKMHVNKNIEKSERKTVNLPTTEELEKRLEILEQQVSRTHAVTSIQKDSDKVQENEQLESEAVDVKIPNKEKSTSHPEEIEGTAKAPEEHNIKTSEGSTIKINTAEENQETSVEEKPEPIPRTEENADNIKSSTEVTENVREIAKEEKLQQITEKIQTEPAKPVPSKDSTTPSKPVGVNNTTSPSKSVAVKDSKTPSKPVKDSTTPSKQDGVKDSTLPSKPVGVKVSATPSKLVGVKDSTSPSKAVEVKDSTTLSKPVEAASTKLDENETKYHPSNTDNTKENKEKSIDQRTKTPASEKDESKESSEIIDINTSEVGQIDPNNKTMVLLLNNEPKSVKVRRLTRANTEELEGLFQALEKQLSERNLVKSEDGKLRRADTVSQPTEAVATKESKAITDLTKEIQEFTSADKEKEKSEDQQPEKFDWGADPVKHHLKRKTAYLPSTKELEARFRSLERQIKLLEDVENIDVEQRLNEIERKIKLQYSLSHEKDLNKYLELCEGKLPEDELIDTSKTKDEQHSRSPHTSPSRGKPKSPYTSPSRSREKTPRTSPTRTKQRTPYSSPTRTKQRSPYTSPTRTKQGSPYTSPSPPPRTKSRSPYISPARQRHQERCSDGIPCLEDLEYRYRVLDLVRSKSKENLSSKHNKDFKKQAIHPLEMLLDPSPDDSDIPTTGELEHRMRVLEEKSITPSPPRKPRNRSPTIDDIKRQKLLQEQRPKTPIHGLETLVVSPTRKELPTAEELETRMRALEEDHKFDFKMQKNFKDFNQKLKDVISPSLSFEEFKAAKSREQSPKRPTTPKSALKDHETSYRRDDVTLRSTSPRTIRFRDEDNRPKSYTEHQRDAGKMVGNADGVLKIIEENSKMLERILKKTLADSNSSINEISGTSEGLDVFAPRFMRETSPIRRTGTHTGIPLRTDDNINDRLNSIKNTIKSIDTLCEEKPYRKEKCQRYIDSLFTDSVYFTSPSKKASLDDLTYKRRSGEYGPSIRVSDHSQRPSDQYLGRSIGSAESLRSTSPLRAASPLHHRSTRDLHRDISPRRRRGDEEREEYESRVRRVKLLPNYLLDDSSEFCRSSLTKFYKVDNELDTYKYDDKARSSSRSASRSPLRSPYGSRETILTTAYTNHHTPTTSNTRLDLDRPVSPYRQTSHNLLGGYDNLKRNNNTYNNPGKLDIRHTTVTSTFYDRFLTEKEIEKSLSRPPSRSPVVSPSVASKSYLDIPMASSQLTSSKSSEHTPTTPVMSSSWIGVTGHVPAVGGASSTFLLGGYNTSVTTTTAAPTVSSISSALYTAATTPTGNSSALSNSYLTRLPTVTDRTDGTEPRIRSCDNILMQLKSSTSTIGAGTTETPYTAGSTTITSYRQLATANVTTATATTTTTTTATIISNYTNFLNQFSTGTGTPLSSMTTSAIITTASESANTTINLTSSGVYNPVLPLSVRTLPPQMPEIGIPASSVVNNNASTSFTYTPKS